VKERYRKSRPLASAVEVEPLEKLAKRKGVELLQFGRMFKDLFMQSMRLPSGNDTVVEGCSVECCRAKAREFLAGLPDKGEK